MINRYYNKYSQFMFCNILLLLFFSFMQCSAEQENRSIEIKTLYGDFVINEPVVLALLEHPFMQRLKHVHQYGPRYYVIKKEDYFRYEHSVGVFALLRKFGASEKEQIAGLLHDVSHTVFSHVGDWFFNRSHLGISYQDSIHEKFINQTGLSKTLSDFKIDVTEINHKNKKFMMLETELPDLCADRLEYNLKGGLIEGLITEQDVKNILADLHYENNQWFFQNVEQAKKLAHVSLHLTRYVWGSPENYVIIKWLADALRYALKIKLINLDDIHYSIDNYVWEQLANSQDQTIRDIMKKIYHYENYFTLGTVNDCDMVIKGKFRGINPWVKTEKTMMRLTDLDGGFQEEYLKIKKTMENGWSIKLH